VFRRVTANVSQSNTVDPTTFDLLVIPGPGAVAGVVITIAAPPTNSTINPVYLSRRFVGFSPHDVTIHGANGTRICQFPQGNNVSGACGLLWDGIDYVVFGAAGNVEAP
jgi:hypothetical protein